MIKPVEYRLSGTCLGVHCSPVWVGTSGKCTKSALPEIVKLLFLTAHPLNKGLPYNNVRVVPGSYLAREVAGQPNLDKNHIRLALVATLDDCVDAANRIVECLSDQHHDQ